MKALNPLLIFCLLAVPAFSQDAKELNSKGYGYYKEGSYETALEYFKKSSDLDPAYPYAHYNYACTMAILIGKDFCGWIGELDNLFDHLYTAVSLRPEYQEKMKTDPDLDPVKHLAYFRNLTIEPTENFWIELISNTDWIAPEEGRNGIVAGLRFNTDKTLEIWFRDPSEVPTGTLIITGTFEDLSQGRYLITLQSEYNGQTNFEGGFREDLSIYFSGIDLRFVDYDTSHCGI